MVEYITFRGKKYPFLIAFSTLIKFQEQTGEDFTKLLSENTNILALGESLLYILKLGLKTGYEISPPSFLKKVYNLVTTGTFIGIKEKDYIYILDNNFNVIIGIIPKFFYSMVGGEVASEEDKKK